VGGRLAEFGPVLVTSHFSREQTKLGSRGQVDQLDVSRNLHGCGNCCKPSTNIAPLDQSAIGFSVHYLSENFHHCFTFAS
jgi:hypothetical protein